MIRGLHLTGAILGAAHFLSLKKSHIYSTSREMQTSPSADHWRIYPGVQSRLCGLELPDRASWIQRVLACFDMPEMPIDLQILIAEYGSSFLIEWRSQKEKLIAIHSLEKLIPFNRKVDFPVMDSEQYHILLTNYSAISGIYFDLLSDDTWHQRQDCVCHIHPYGCGCANPRCTNEHPKLTCLPRDAYTIRRGGTDELIKNIGDSPDSIIITMHREASIRGKLMFRADVF